MVDRLFQNSNLFIAGFLKTGLAKNYPGKEKVFWPAAGPYLARLVVIVPCVSLVSLYDTENVREGNQVLGSLSICTP